MATPMRLDDEAHMRMAFELAAKGYGEGGCPIGGVLVDNATGEMLGKGHNALVQEGNPILHGEMAAMRDAGRMPDRHDTTMYTTLQPCFMCTGTIVQFGIPRVVIGDVLNTAATRPSASCARAASRSWSWTRRPARRRAIASTWSPGFAARSPSSGLEDWGGGPNPKLVRATG